MSCSTETKHTVFYGSPYDIYPNVREHNLSHGEIGDFNRFLGWVNKTIKKFTKGVEGYQGHFGQASETAEIKFVPDIHDSNRKLLQVIVGVDDLVQTSFTLTGNGLVRQVRLPHDATITETIEGQEAQEVLTYLRQNLRP